MAKCQESIMMHIAYDLPSDQTHATLYNGGAIVGSIARPYETRTFQKAVPHGDKWRVTDRDGVCRLVTCLRPSRAAIARALSC
jgi:hypothetical protein